MASTIVARQASETRLSLDRRWDADGVAVAGFACSIAYVRPLRGKSVSAARILLALAGRIMPASSQIWLRAMVNELDHVSAKERFGFALGCLWSALIERMKSMNADIGRIRVLVFSAAMAWSLYYLAVSIWAMTHGEHLSVARGDSFYLTIFAPIMTANFAIMAWLIGSARQWRIASAAASLLVLGFTALCGIMFVGGGDHLLWASKVLGPALLMVSLAMLITGIAGVAANVVRRAAA